KNFSVFRSPNGHIGFKDFASGDGGLFTALLYGFGYTTFEAQIRFAASVYGITVKGSGVRGYSEVSNHSPLVIGHSSSDLPKHVTKHQLTNDQVTNDQVTKHQATKHRRRYRVTALELDDFTPVELQTLARVSAGLITPELLASYGIRALRSYTDEGVSDKGFAYGGEHEARFTLVVPSANGNYYAYCYFGAEKHSPFPSQSKNFHLKLGEYTAEVKFALGLAELRPNEPAYLVEGIKDCLILLTKGYNAFTLGGVQHRLHPSVVKRLQENGNSLNIVFDTDFAGISAAQKLAHTLSPTRALHSTATITEDILQAFVNEPEYRKRKTTDNRLPYSIIELPRLERQETKDEPKPANNDLADYVCQYGFDNELEYALLSPAPLRSTTMTKAGLSVPAWNLAIKSKISAEPQALKALTNLIDQSSRLILRAPAGCGKTHAILRHIAPQHFQRTDGGMTIFAVPTLALAEQIQQEYADLKPIVVTGNQSDIHRYYDSFSDFTYDDNGNFTEQQAKTLDTCLIVAVYDSVERLWDILLDPSTLLVVDEMHKLIQDYDYRLAAMRGMKAAITVAPKVIGMSATPELLFHEAPLSFTYCDIAVQEQRPLAFSFQSYQNRDEAILMRILSLLHKRTAPDLALIPTLLPEGEGQDTETLLEPSPSGRGQGEGMEQNAPEIIMLRVQSKAVLWRIEQMLIKQGVDEQSIAVITNDTAPTSPEYQYLIEHRRFGRTIILTTSILDCGINILNTGRIEVIVCDEKNDDTIIQIANRFRKASDIHVTILFSDKQGTDGKGQGASNNSCEGLPSEAGSRFDDSTSLMPTTMPYQSESLAQGSETLAPKQKNTRPKNRTINTKYHFLSTLTSAQMIADGMNNATGRNDHPDCGMSRKSASRLFDTMLYFDGKRGRWLHDEFAIMHHCAKWRIARTSNDDLAKALQDYGFTQRHTEPISTSVSPEIRAALEEVERESKQQRILNEETTLTLLATKTAYFLAALGTVSRSRTLKNILQKICPEALTSLYKNHTETAAILTNHAALLQQARTLTLVRYYAEARTLGFEHTEAIFLVSTYREARKWQSLTKCLAMKQRETIRLAGLTDSILNKHDREKLQREEEIRRMVRTTAELGCTLTKADGSTRHIPNALRTKREIMERANAYQSTLFRLTQQQAGELVDAMFHVHYVRERVQTENGNRFSGYYAFDANEQNVLTPKTLAELVSEYGVDGATYQRLFLERVQSEARRYEEAQERAARYEKVEWQEGACAVTR
ncbi:MAG: DEAD/DEAH box helicase, partial [Candidatus Kapaibacteriota bacterium]